MAATGRSGGDPPGGQAKIRPLHPRRIADPSASFIWVGDKNLKKLQKKAWEAGWWPEPKRAGIMWLAPDSQKHVMLHRSDSDHHAYDNALALFRAAGLDA